MPKLSPDTRRDIERRSAIADRIHKSFEERQYTAQHCRFCGWASNGLTLDEAIAENGRHEASHPEQQEYDANLPSIDEVVHSLHDHECVYARCACICGCQESAGCILVLGPLCSSCLVRANRGDREHGESSAPLPGQMAMEVE